MNIQELITRYHPSRAAVQLIEAAKVVLLVGISGAGKDTIKQQLLLDEDFKDIVSHTTRAPRANNGISESPGVDYHFIDESTAAGMLERQEFIEAKFVHGTVYGTSLVEVESAHKAGKIAITDVDVQGVEEYKELSQDVVAIFIIPPDFATWQARLKKRYATEGEFLAEWPRRRASAIDELRHALEVSYYHFVTNDELRDAVESVSKIAHKPDIFTRKDDESRLAARDLLTLIEQHP